MTAMHAATAASMRIVCARRVLAVDDVEPLADVRDRTIGLPSRLSSAVEHQQSAYRRCRARM